MAVASRNLVERDWEDVQAWLPDNLEELASSSGVIQRRRSVRSGLELLRLALAYSLLDLSLRSVSAWMAGTGLGQMSDVAILKRLRGAGGFLEALLKEMLNRKIVEPVRTKFPLKVRLIDATTVSEPGSTGADWRLHTVYDPVRGCIDSVELTDVHGGEHFGRAGVQAGELIIGDRGYAHVERIRAVRKAEAHVLVRIGHSAIRLFDEAGTRVDPLAFALRARSGPGRPMRVESRPVWIHGAQCDPLPARLIIVRKSREAAERERRKARAEAKSKGNEITDRTLQAAAFTFLLTTVEEGLASDVALAELYRVRWQIELAFKRLKSLLGLDSLRAKDPLLIKTYLLAKMIAAVLMEDIADQCRAFSPWGLPLRSTAQSLA
jgi:IS4 transposase